VDGAGNPHPSDSSKTSYRSQISCVFKHPDREDLYVAMADRWLPELTEEQSNVSEMFGRLYSGQPIESSGYDLPEFVSDPNISLADYVWLPFRFEGTMPVLDWHDGGGWRTTTSAVLGQVCRS
jgi:hypothetical protein